MRAYSKVRIFPVVAALFAVLLLSAPGYSWADRGQRGSGGYYNTNGGHGHHWNGHRNHGRAFWGGYYGGFYDPYYYRPSYYGPSVSVAFPFLLPGISFYIGP
jgi:hypothetical protein